MDGYKLGGLRRRFVGGFEVLVRLSGFEPPRSCDRQPLKLVRLPIPPQPQWGGYF